MAETYLSLSRLQVAVNFEQTARLCFKIRLTSRLRE